LVDARCCYRTARGRNPGQRDNKINTWARATSAIEIRPELKKCP
jgi:hypothetical protein